MSISLIRTDSVMGRTVFRRVLPLLAVASMLGCAGEEAANKTSTPNSTPESEAHANHAHPEKGPHDGDLVELGDEEYHAEVVHGENGQISVYVLDGTAAKVVAIDAAEMTINVTHAGEAKQFSLPANADASDPQGMSSRFSIQDQDLAADLDSHFARAKLVVMINGKSYTGKIEHSHDDDHKH